MVYCHILLVLPTMKCVRRDVEDKILRFDAVTVVMNVVVGSRRLTIPAR